MAEEKNPVKWAWGDKHRHSFSSMDEKQLEEIVSSSLSPWEGAESLDVERTALDYVCGFIQRSGQDSAERLKFMDQLDILCNTPCIDGFTLYTSELLVDIVKFLIPWTASSNVEERERATKKMAEICHGIQSLKDTNGFPVIGQLVGCLTLCCCDSSEEVARWAAEGLSYLCSLLLRNNCQPMADESRESLQREWEQEDTQWNTWLNDPTQATMFFKKYLSPEDLTDFLVVAISGMEDNSIHSTQAAVCIVKALLRDPSLSLGQVSSLVIFIHAHIDSITDAFAQQEVLRTLTIMGKNYMNEVVKTLLSCSLQSESTATSMWNILVCFSDLAEEVLAHFLACIQGRPLWPNVSAEEATLLSFATIRVLHELLQQPLPSFKEEIKDHWEKLCLTLIFWISKMFHRKIWASKSFKSYVPGSVEPASVSLARLAGSTVRAVLRHADCGNEGLLMKKHVIWDFLSKAETFHQGVSLLARAIVRCHLRELKWMVEYVMAILDGPDESEHVTAMGIFAELLQSPGIGIVRDKDLLRHLSRQLTSSKAVLRSLAVDGMIHVAENPDHFLSKPSSQRLSSPCLSDIPLRKLQAIKLLPLLPEVLKRLQEPDRELTLKALRLLKFLICHLEGESNSSLTLEVAKNVLPLFDDESHKVRSLAICIFGNILETATSGTTAKMKGCALQSLVPLLMHLHDRSPVVIAACWDTLSSVAKALNFRKLHPLILNRDKWSICLVITKSYRKVPECHFLSQSLKHLKSPQTPIREVAIRLIGLAAQETKSKRKLEIICKALNELQDDSKPSVSCLAVQTMKVLEAVHDEIPSGCSIRALLYRICRTCMR